MLVLYLYHERVFIRYQRSLQTIDVSDQRQLDASTSTTISSVIKMDYLARGSLIITTAASIICWATNEAAHTLKEKKELKS